MNTRYWEEEIETMSREELKELQLQRLRKTISIAANAPYYKEVLPNTALPPTPSGHWKIFVKYHSQPKRICVPIILSAS